MHAHARHRPLSLHIMCALLLGVGVTSLSAHAQDLTHKAPPQAATTLIHNAVIHTLAGETINDAAIIFDAGTITALTANAPLHPPAEWRVIDAKGLHIYPALIAPYTQLGLTEIQAVPASNDLSETGAVTPEVRATDAVNPDSTLLTVTRANGVLIAGVFPGGGPIAGQPGVIRLDGWTVRDMAIAPSMGVVVIWPNVRPITAWWMDRSEEDQMKDIRENLATIERTFDTARAYADEREAHPDASIDLRWEAMRPLFASPADAGDSRNDHASATRQPRVYVHAQDLDQINSAVQFATSRGLKMVLVGGRDAEQAAPLLRQHDIPVIVLGTHVLPRRDDAPYDDAYTLPARLRAAGLTVAIANNDDTAHERNLPYSAAMAAAHGLTPEQALECITINAARVLGIDDRYGTLEKGKSASFILTTGDPLEVTTRVVGAFLDGREIDLTNKQSKLAEKYMERYRQTGDIPVSK